MVGIAPEPLGAALDVRVIALGIAQFAAAGEDHLGTLGRELTAGVRSAGLDDDRPALDRAGDIQRTAHRQELALVVEHMQPVGVKIDPVFDVTDEGVLGPAVPQPGYDIEELAGAAIALAMLHVLGHPEIQRRVGVGGRDQIPAGASAADVVERGEAPGDHVRWLEGRRGGGDQSEMLGHHRQRR